MAKVRDLVKSFRSWYRLLASSKSRPFVVVSVNSFYSTTTTERENESDIEKETDDVDCIKVSILNAALEFVPQHGWSRQALASGAEKLGYSGVAHGMFPDGAAELVHHFYYSSNRDLEEQLKTNEFQQILDGPIEDQQERFIRNALKARLHMIVPYLNNWPQAMAIMSSPQNIPNALRNLQDLVDTVWFYAGDKSTDLRWYGKRLVLSTIYKTTELCLLQDSSEDYNSTWLFLDRRVADYINAKRSVGQLQDFNQVLAGGTITIWNMLGMGRINR